jgi:hypothetical protein
VRDDDLLPWPAQTALKWVEQVSKDGWYTP